MVFQLIKLDYECRRRGVHLSKVELSRAVPRVSVHRIEFDIQTDQHPVVTETTEETPQDPDVVVVEA